MKYFDKNGLLHGVVHQRETEGRDKHARADMALAKAVGETLTSHYSGHSWMVVACHRTGLVKVKLPFMVDKVWYTIRISELASDPGLRSIIKAGGEILERFNIPRSSGHIFDQIGRIPLLSPQQVKDAHKR